MKEIPLSANGDKHKGKYVTLVSDEDYDWLNQWNWIVLISPDTCYAVRNVYVDKQIRQLRMHRVILGLEKGDKREGDHIDHNGLNNQRNNLRIATNGQNQGNTRKIKQKSSKYKGVHWDKRRNKWKSEIKVNYKPMHLGRFSNEEDAARAYDMEALKYFGEFANLNFPK